MSFQIPVHSVSVGYDAQTSFDSLFAEVLDCLKREQESILELLVLFESMKQQVLELAEKRAGGLNASSVRAYPYKQALAELEQELLEASDLKGDARSTLFLLLSMAYYRIGSLLQARNMAMIARSEYSRCGVEQKIAFADLLIAICSLELTQYEQAADRCVLALAESTLSDDPIGIAQIWQVYARILYKQGRTEESVAALVMASEIYREQGAAAKQVKTLLELSLVLIGHDDLHGAVYRSKQALMICHQRQLQALEIEVLDVLAHLFLKMGRTVEVEGCRQRIYRLMGTEG
ncbi:hypothetical protein [Effusibacillus consociatus]|uniref:MalT-like TPR region domain-containing protein n=1 Tax=Effusibacillus consociatus TaxID=1117041 RepID=A0ABV9Q0Y5_9BACL